jgi:glycosyltransferase involved in cell wall biosynthesis
LNIAFLVPYAPTRIRTRPFHFLKTLAQSGHHLTLFTVWSDKPERDALAEIESFGIKVIATPLTRVRALRNSLRAVPTTTPLQACYSWEPHLAQRWLDALGASKFQVIHVEHLRGARYAGAAVDLFGELPLVWDSVDCISALFGKTRAKSAKFKDRLISRIEHERTRAWEAALIRKLPETVVVSDDERRALLALPSSNEKNPAPHLHVVPNGIDTEYFARGVETREPNTIVFSGKLSYHANITAAHFLMDEIMPLVWAKEPTVRVLLVGANPPAALRKYAERGDARVTVTGTVPDMRPFLARATITVAPMVYAAGMQNKIMEAMAMQTPVITTPDAAVPLGAQTGRDVLTAESASEFAGLILKTLNTPALQKTLAESGRALVEGHLSWRAAVEKLLDVYSLAHANWLV